MGFAKQPEFLAHNWTKMVNGVFIWLVFVRHFGILGGYSDRSFFMWERCYLGQLIVTTFLFFSGYGLMRSLAKSPQEYLTKLVKERFPRIWGTFAAMVMLYAGARSCMGAQYSWSHIMMSLTGWESVGEPTWYIFMTLVEYLLIWVAFRSFGVGRSGAAVSMVGGLTLLLIYAISSYKEKCWYNTILCMPVGMLAALHKSELQRCMQMVGRWVWIPVVVVVLLGAWVHKEAYGWCREMPLLRVWFGSLVANAGAILFAGGMALGVARATMLQCDLQGGIIGRFLLWCGGSSLIYIFLLHNLPMHIGAYMEWNRNHEVLYFVFCVLFTLLSVFILDMKWFAYIKSKKYINSKTPE